MLINFNILILYRNPVIHVLGERKPCKTIHPGIDI